MSSFRQFRAARLLTCCLFALLGMTIRGECQSPYGSYRDGQTSGHSVSAMSYGGYNATSGYNPAVNPGAPQYGNAAMGETYYENTPSWHSAPPQDSWSEAGMNRASGWNRPISSVIRLEPETTRPMLDFQNRQGDKQLILLENQPSGDAYPSVALGAQFRMSAMVARTNTADHFPYLGRFPTDFAGHSATDLRILQANQAGILNFTPWATGYFETLFSDVFSFSSFKQGSFQVRQAYVVFGNLDVTPFYMFLGKKNVSFGDMGTLSPFTQSVVWHYFAPLAEQGGIGYAANGFNFTVTGINGLRGIRVVDSSQKGHVNNFAVNGIYTWNRGEDFSWSVGAGYLHGTIYDGQTAEHLDPGVTGPLNSAWDVNTHMQWGPMHFNGEFITTVNPWPVTGHEVSAWHAEMAYDANTINLPLWLSLSYGEGVQGARGTEFQSNRQFVAGAAWTLSPSSQLTFEYVRSMGFAPLLGITTVSDQSVRQNSLIFGLVLTL
ncbi:MAG: LbtU family siderophore porin [Planctomycetaceae bacterium]